MVCWIISTDRLQAGGLVQSADGTQHQHDDAFQIKRKGLHLSVRTLASLSNLTPLSNHIRAWIKKYCSKIINSILVTVGIHMLSNIIKCNLKCMYKHSTHTHTHKLKSSVELTKFWSGRVPPADMLGVGAVAIYLSDTGVGKAYHSPWYISWSIYHSIIGHVYLLQCNICLYRTWSWAHRSSSSQKSAPLKSREIIWLAWIIFA